MDSIDLEGRRLELRHIPAAAGGTRAPLVFLHEGLGSVSLWRQRGLDWPALLCERTGRAGWIYSRRGYGRSDPILDVRGEPRWQGFWHEGRHEPDYMHIEAWQVLPRLLQELGIRRPVLVGHSDGATIALLHASRHPVAACVVMAPHLFVEDIALQAIEGAREAFVRCVADGTGLRDRLARHHTDVDNAFWQWNDVWLSPAFRAFDIRPPCRAIQAPLLAVQGEQDEYGSLAQLQELARCVPGLKQAILAECGHSPHRDQPEALTAAIQAFLAAGD
jgi:pimeloyl-ACP methyl ester carboxylesterase